jgi:hypothetical protein
MELIDSYVYKKMTQVSFKLYEAMCKEIQDLKDEIAIMKQREIIIEDVFLDAYEEENISLIINELDKNNSKTIFDNMGEYKFFISLSTKKDERDDTVDETFVVDNKRFYCRKDETRNVIILNIPYNKINKKILFDIGKFTSPDTKYREFYHSFDKLYNTIGDLPFVDATITLAKKTEHTYNINTIYDSSKVELFLYEENNYELLDILFKNI